MITSSADATIATSPADVTRGCWPGGRRPPSAPSPRRSSGATAHRRSTTAVPAARRRRDVHAHVGTLSARTRTSRALTCATSRGSRNERSSAPQPNGTRARPTTGATRAGCDRCSQSYPRLDAGPDDVCGAVLDGPEAGFFGVAPGTGESTKPQREADDQARRDLHQLRADRRRGRLVGGYDRADSQLSDRLWRGNDRTADAEHSAAHPNARFRSRPPSAR